MKVSSKDKLYGLLLIGGKSSRMGVDKSTIEYHGMAQRDYLYSLLKKVCDDVFFSIHKKQPTNSKNNPKYIIDKNIYLGPFDGMMSAHIKYPEVAWLVLPCDLPFLDLDSLQQLINNRKRDKLVTAFCKTTTQLPEPLCAIWESKSFELAEKYFKKGEGASPSKFLQTIDIESIYPKDDRVLMNVNTLGEYQKVKNRINSKNNLDS